MAARRIAVKAAAGAHFSRGWGRARSMGGQVHHLVVASEREPIVVPQATQAKPPKPWWREMRDPKLEDLPKLVPRMPPEEFEEVWGRQQWAEVEAVLPMETFRDLQEVYVHPLIQARNAKLLRIYFKLVDDLATLRGKEAPTTRDRKLLYNVRHARETFIEAYEDRIWLIYDTIGPETLKKAYGDETWAAYDSAKKGCNVNEDWNMHYNIYSDALGKVLEEVIAELELEVAQNASGGRTAEAGCS